MLILLSLISLISSQTFLYELNEKWFEREVENVLQRLAQGFDVPEQSLNQVKCQKYNINEIRTVQITNLTALSHSLKSVDVQIKDESLSLKVKLNNITLKVGEIVTQSGEQSFGDELKFTGKKVIIHIIFEINHDKKLTIKESQINVSNFTNFQFKCRNKRLTQDEKKLYFDAFKLAMTDVIQIVLDHQMNQGLLKDLTFNSVVNKFQCLGMGHHNLIEKQPLLNIQPTKRVIISEKYFQQRVQEDYMKGKDSVFFFEQKSRDQDSEVEMDAHTMRTLFPKMNVSSQIIVIAQPILGQIINLTLQEGYMNGTMPFHVNVYEDTYDNEAIIYCSFNVSAVVKLSFQQNLNGTSLYVEDIDLIDFQFNEDVARFNHKKSIIFLPFLLRFIMGMSNQQFLSKPELNQFASIQKGQITIDYIHTYIN